MKIVIQCAGNKHPGAASLLGADGRPLLFLARPELAPPSVTHAYARPDDVSDDGQTWRSRLRDYNNQPKDDPLNLLPAYQLYSHPAYRALVDRFGLERVFILSAGWGLIPASFLTPEYDITFTNSADPWNRRRQADRYQDFCLMPDDGDDIVFLGGKDYLPLFSRLTAPLQGEKIVFFNMAHPPDLPSGFRTLRYVTKGRTNWHYACANALIAGEIHI